MKIFYRAFLILNIIIITILFYDASLYYNAYSTLISLQKEVSYLVAKNGGINNDLKTLLVEKNIFVEYEKSGDINGATFEFKIYKKVDYLLVNNNKYVYLNITVILGYY